MRLLALLACGLAACFPCPPSPAPGPGATAPVVSGAASAPAAVGAIPLRLDVVLDPFKANGQAWDAGGEAPDLAVCVSAAGPTQCLPSGSSVSSVTAPACRDALRCSFTGVSVPPGPVLLEVIDVDAVANDVAGDGPCYVGATCRVGQATVTVSDARGAAPAVTAPLAPAMTPPALAAGSVPPQAQAVITRLRQAIAASDMLALRGLLSEDGDYSIGPGLVAETAQAAAEGFRANPAALAELDRVLAMPCSAEEDDGQTIVTCPRVTSDDYEGPIAVVAEEDEGTFLLMGFIRP